ncbi:hypothetical protein TNCV_2797921 [Trichonephila clavipes]|nr:hypothetical protein TNCV_2797921 [Trichonephila clavipes]
MRVFDHFSLKSTANKQTHHEDLLRQLALEIISCIPVVSNPSLSSNARQSPHEQERFSRNSISGTSEISSDPNEKFLDSSTALRLSDWSSSNDETSVSNLFKLRKISQMHDVHIQWISSHVNNRGNEVTDRLTKVGSENEAATGNSFTYQERTKMEDQTKNLTRRIPPTH